MTPSLTDTSTLRDAGTVLLPGDRGFEAATVPWNLAVVQRPAAVAVPRSADEVARVVTAATALGLRVAPQSTG
ncbi:FAD-binding oxidoreductase, partial [Agromyces binzhouensis]